ncbi:MAG: aminotransferase class I/II-fold pyridoxal phosphate-dependent enzyme [Saprospiraceae bacterium]|nr:aminotransferase class I/II-fold pyridoxal phosphate-dependent enzyme [Saprospiraceae bacterium]
MHLSEILYHLGEEREHYFNAVSTPVIQSSNFAFKDLEVFRNSLKNELSSHLYTRGNNPTVKILRQKIAALESAEDALVFASGSAAISAAVIAQVNAGDHIVCVNAPYSWTNVLLKRFLPRFGVASTYVDATDTSEIEKAIRPNTKVLYLESPNSLTFEMQDLAACAAICQKHGLVSIIDNSYCSPIFQRPIEWGIDLVVHSATKYLNGHSDVVAGVVCGSKALIQKIFDTEQMCLGAIISPHDANLITRGLRTLPLRMKRSDESAQKVVEWLEAHPKVKKIYYPFLEDTPQYELAKKQMSGCGGLFSIETTAETLEEAEAFFYRLKRFLFAVSWGGHESLVFPTCSLYGIEGKSNPPLPFNFYRFYIGLEEPEWLIEDLAQAFGD